MIDCTDKCVPFVRSKPEIVRKAFKLAGLKKGETLVELGSGDGQNLIIAAKEFGAKAIGYEIDPILVKYSRERVKKEGLSGKVIVREESFVNAEKDLRKADVVYMYLLPTVINEVVKPMLLGKKLRVISLAFPINGWTPTVVEGRIYVYDLRSGTSGNRKVSRLKQTTFASLEDYAEYVAEKYKPILTRNPNVVDVRAEGKNVVVVVKGNALVPTKLEGLNVIGRKV